MVRRTGGHIGGRAYGRYTQVKGSGRGEKESMFRNGIRVTSRSEESEEKEKIHTETKRVGSGGERISKKETLTIQATVSISNRGG